MDKRVVFAVAGSGKTSLLIANLNETQRFLIVTYTESNFLNLRSKIIQRFGYLPTNITLYTYFRFLHGFCYRPFLSSEKNTKGVTFQIPPKSSQYKPTGDRHYICPVTRRLYSNRLAKLVQQSNLIDSILARMEKYFDAFFVDEVQDFAGHDFNLLKQISDAELNITFVGDFFQHTFDTSRDGNVNKNLHNDFEAYKARFKSANLAVDTDSLKKSYRCSKSVCDFITEKIGIPIEAHEDRDKTIEYVDAPETVRFLYNDPETVKLFYQEHHKYGCFSQNWGASKGIDRYQDVCVVLNANTVKAWKEGTFCNINPITRNKLYVACSRARGNLKLIPEAMLKQFKQL